MSGSTRTTLFDNASVGTIEILCALCFGHSAFYFRTTGTGAGNQFMEGEIYYDKKLTTSAIMIALAVVLAWVSKIIPAPWMQGGSITFARHGANHHCLADV